MIIELGTDCDDWDPNEHQGRSKEQVEANAQVASWVGIIGIVVVLALIASVVGNKLLSIMAGL